jgi:phosphoglycolate phosphatase
MSAIAAIIFDYDGTLFDTRPAIIHCIERTFALAALPIPPKAAMLRTVAGGITLQDTFLLLDEALQRNRAALHDRVKTYRTLYQDEGTALLKPFPGAAEVLRELHARGTICIVVSNKGSAAIHHSLDAASLRPFVDLVLADEAGLPKKPDPALITDHVLPRYAGLQSHQILMVGDTATDILFARAGGMPCCWASYGYGDAERCRALTPEHEISRIGELPALLAVIASEAKQSSL